MLRCAGLRAYSEASDLSASLNCGCSKRLIRTALINCIELSHRRTLFEDQQFDIRMWSDTKPNQSWTSCRRRPVRVDASWLLQARDSPSYRSRSDDCLCSISVEDKHCGRVRGVLLYNCTVMFADLGLYTELEVSIKIDLEPPFQASR